MLVTFMALGLLQSISAQARQPATAKSEAPPLLSPEKDQP